MINRRTFLFALAYGGVSNALWSQSRMDTAQQFVASTQKYAEDLGRALADQDMINIALKVLIRADEVGNAFRAYDKIHGAIIVSLENQVGALLQAPRRSKSRLSGRPRPERLQRPSILGHVCPLRNHANKESTKS